MLRFIFLYLFSLVPLPIGIGNSSLIDLFLPLLVTVFAIRSIKSKYIALTFSLYIILCLLLIAKVFEISNSIFVLGWCIRFFLLFLPILVFLQCRYSSVGVPFFSSLSGPVKSSIYLSLLFVILSLVSFLHYVAILQPPFWALGFPIYSNGLDPHVFGPTLSLLVVSNTYLLFSRNYQLNFKTSLPLYLSTLLLFVFSVVTASRGVFAIYLAASTFLLFRYILIAIRANSFSLPSPVIILISSFLFTFFPFILSFFNLDNNSLFTRVFLRVARLETIPSLFLNPSQDASRGQKVLDFAQMIVDTDLWLFGKSYFVPVYDSGILLVYQNFGLLFSIVILFLFVIVILANLGNYPLPCCLLFCALAHFTFASETLLIPRYCLILTSLVYVFSRNPFHHKIHSS